MTGVMSISHLATCLCLFASIARVASGSYAAFMYQPLGVQLFVLDSAGRLTYSLCNSDSTPVYPTEPPLVLPVAVQPKVGSNIAAVGWFAEGEVYADVFWQNSGFTLEHERFKCNMSDGTYSLVLHESPDDALSASADMPEVSVSTGLAAVRLSSTGGTRLFFHDSGGALQQLEYTSSGGWKYIGPVDPDGNLQGPSLSAVVIDGTFNMYTVMPRSDNIEIANTKDGETWEIEITPQPHSNSDTASISTHAFTLDNSHTARAKLQAWSSGISSLGLAIDQDESKHIYYIGSDKVLHYLTSRNELNLGSWSIEESLDMKYWPLADDADGEFAVACDPSTYDIRVYYMSGGAMTEVSRTGKDTWAEARALPTKVTATASGLLLAEASRTTVTFSFDPSSTVTSPSKTKGNDESGGISPGAIYGIVIAAGVLVLSIVATLVGCYFPRRRIKREQERIALAPQQSGISTFGGNKPREYDNTAGSQQGVGLLNDNGGAKDINDSGVASPIQDYNPGSPTSPKSYRHAVQPVYEPPVYGRGKHSAKHELPGSDDENMSISSAGPDSQWQSPVASPRSLYSNGRRYTPPAMDLPDSPGQLKPCPLSPASSGRGVVYPSQAHAVYRAKHAGNSPTVPLSPLPQLGSPGTPEPTRSRAMSPQHPPHRRGASHRGSQGSWSLSTQVHGQSHRGPGFEEAGGI